MNTLPAWLAPVLARLERRHWLAMLASLALHFALLLTWPESAPPEPEPITFEIAMEPEPPKPERIQTRAHETKVAKAVKKKIKRKPRKREPEIIEAKWEAEHKPAPDTPPVSLPDAETLGVPLATPAKPERPAPLQAAGAQPAAQSGAMTTTGPAASPEALSAASPAAPARAESMAGLVAATGQGLSSPNAAGGQVSELMSGAAAVGAQPDTQLTSQGAPAQALAQAGSGQGGQISHASTDTLAAPGEGAGDRMSASEAHAGAALAPTEAASSQLAEVSGAGAMAPSSPETGSPQALTRSQSNRSAPVAGKQQAAGAQSQQAGPLRSAGAAESPGLSVDLVAPNQADALPLTYSRTQSGTRPNVAGGSLANQGAAKTGPLLAQAAAPAPLSRTAGSGNTTGGSAQAPGIGSTATAPPPHAGVGLSSAQAGLRTALASQTLSTGGKGNAPGNTQLSSHPDAESGGRLDSAANTPSALAFANQTGKGPALRAGPTTSMAQAGRPGSTPELAIALPAIEVRLQNTGPNGTSSAAGSGQRGKQAYLAAPVQATALAGNPSAASASPGARGLSSASTEPAATATQTPSGNPALTGGATSQAPGSHGVASASPEKTRVGSNVAAKQLGVVISTLEPIYQPDTQATTFEANTLQAICPVSFGKHKPTFTFPRQAMYMRHSGTVVVRVEVLPNGRAGKMWIKQSSNSSILDQDAQNQLATWQFEPATHHGKPVSAWVDVPVHYELQ